METDQYKPIILLLCEIYMEVNYFSQRSIGGAQWLSVSFEFEGSLV